MYVDLARQAPLRETNGVCVEDRRARKQTDQINRQVTKGYAIWFINSANFSSPFGFLQDDKV